MNVSLLRKEIFHFHNKYLWWITACIFTITPQDNRKEARVHAALRLISCYSFKFWLMYPLTGWSWWQTITLFQLALNRPVFWRKPVDAKSSPTPVGTRQQRVRSQHHTNRIQRPELCDWRSKIQSKWLKWRQIKATIRELKIGSILIRLLRSYCM